MKRLLGPLLFVLFLIPSFVAAASCPNLYRTLGPGSRGNDVVELQNFLIERGDLAAGNNTGFYGNLTRMAVQKFQCEYMNICSGSIFTNGYGLVGPKTRAAIANACKGASPNTTGGTTATCSLNVSPSSIRAGDSALLTWTSANVTSGFIDPIGQVSLNGSRSVSPAQTTNYVGTFSSLGAQVQCGTKLTVLSQTCEHPAPAAGCYWQPGATCAEDKMICPASSCTFNSQTIPNGQSVIAYQSSSVPAGQQCVSESRICTNGTLSGSYTNTSCTVGTPVSCTLDGVTVQSGQSRTFYSDAAVAYGSTCSSLALSRTCTNGTLSGSDSYKYSTCVVGDPNACSFNSQSVAHGASVTAYQAQTVAYGQQCVSESRVCGNGTLTGSYQYASCSVAPAASCVFNNQSIPNGQSVTAYLASSVSYGQQCTSETRTCSNGTLTGSYLHSACTVSAAASCTAPWGASVAHGGSVTAYQNASVPAGQQCVSESRACVNGSLGGSYLYQNCSVAAASQETINVTPSSGPAPLYVNFAGKVKHEAGMQTLTIDTGGYSFGGTVGNCANGYCDYFASYLYTTAGTYTAKLILNNTIRATTQVTVTAAQPTRPIPLDTATVGTMQAIIGPVRNMYAPSVANINGTKRMWLCGWKTDNDPNDFLNARAQGVDVTTIVGPDKIWYSDLINGTWTSPALSFQKVGWHVCDPSIVKPPSTDGIDRSQWLYMYYTGLDNRHSENFNDIVTKNVAGLASSIDGGITWTDQGIVITTPQGGDGFGAWSPSALVVGNEIWLYYNTGNQDFSQVATFRQRMNANGWQKIGAPEKLIYPEGSILVPGNTVPLMSNLDVHYDGSKYILVANTYDINNVPRYVSTDGLTWYKASNDVMLVHGGSNKLAAPTIEITGPNSFSLYFGFGGTELSFTGIHRWDFTTQ